MTDQKTTYLENGGVVVDPADQIDDDELTPVYNPDREVAK